MGIYYFACTSIARGLGVADEPAAAVAALSHATAIATHIAIGLVVAFTHQDKLGELLRVRRAVESSRPAP
jgi:hypothetical protein